MKIRQKKQNDKRNTKAKLVFDSSQSNRLRGKPIYIHAYDKCIGITCLGNDGSYTYKISLNEEEVNALKDAIKWTLESKDSRTFNI